MSLKLVECKNCGELVGDVDWRSSFTCPNCGLVNITRDCLKSFPMFTEPAKQTHLAETCGLPLFEFNYGK